MAKSVKRFERSNGLDTALYKNYLYLYFAGPLLDDKSHVVGRDGSQLAKYMGPIWVADVSKWAGHVGPTWAAQITPTVYV